MQAARESARRLQCQNNIKQLALGCLNHEQAQGFLPVNGWWSFWVGDPDRGFSIHQPGGWVYNVLPYIEQQPMHDLGAGKDPATKAALFAQREGIPQGIFICPTRRKVAVEPNVGPAGTSWMLNMNYSPTWTRSDYAINAGTGIFVYDYEVFGWSGAYGTYYPDTGYSEFVVAGGEPSGGPQTLADGDDPKQYPRIWGSSFPPKKNGSLTGFSM